MAITNEQLQSAFARPQSKQGGRKEDYFPALYLAEKFSKPLEDVLGYCSFGKNPYGFEAYYVDRETRNLYLYLFRWSDNYEQFKEGYKTLIENGIEKIFTDDATLQYGNSMFSRLKMDLQEYRSVIDKVYIGFVFNGDPEKAEGSRVLESLREELESKKH